MNDKTNEIIKLQDRVLQNLGVLQFLLEAQIRIQQENNEFMEKLNDLQSN